MARGSGGVPGLAVALATVGGFFVYIGLRNVPIVEGLRELVKGKTPTPRPTTPGTIPPELLPDTGQLAGNGGGGGGAGGGGSGNAIADAARRYIGNPYVWGGAVPTQAGGPGMDCSGLVTWVLVHDIGLKNLPSSTHTTTLPFLAWSGASTIARDQCAAGDLVCWTGHIGIATGRDTMIHAPDIGQTVKESTIWNIPAPTIRRVKLDKFSQADGGVFA